MNLPEHSEKLMAEIKAKAQEFALDNGFSSEQAFTMIEAAMMTGALIASGYFAQIEQPEYPFCCGHPMNSLYDGNKGRRGHRCDYCNKVIWQTE